MLKKLMKILIKKYIRNKIFNLHNNKLKQNKVKIYIKTMNRLLFKLTINSIYKYYKIQLILKYLFYIKIYK